MHCVCERERERESKEERDIEREGLLFDCLFAKINLVWVIQCRRERERERERERRERETQRERGTRMLNVDI